MNPISKIMLGMTAEKTVTVTHEMTIGHFVANMPRVYATPMMILHMEMASGSAIASHLPEGFVSVGMDVKIRHLAATPVGRAVRATSRIIQIDSKAWCSRSRRRTATEKSAMAPIAAASSMRWSSKSGLE